MDVMQFFCSLQFFIHDHLNMNNPQHLIRWKDRTHLYANQDARAFSQGQKIRQGYKFS